MKSTCRKVRSNALPLKSAKLGIGIGIGIGIVMTFTVSGSL